MRSKKFPIDLQWENVVSMLAHSFLVESSSKLMVTRTGIKARTSSILGLRFPWPIYLFFEIRFDLGTLDLGERSLPFGLLVVLFIAVKTDSKLTSHHMEKIFIIQLTEIKFKIWRVTFFNSFYHKEIMGWTFGFSEIRVTSNAH